MPPTFIVFTTAVIAQDARIRQDIPLQRRTKTLDNDPLLKSLRATNKQDPATGSAANAASVEDRIAALEAKVAELQREVEAQKAIIKQLQDRLDQQQKKN